MDGHGADWRKERGGHDQGGTGCQDDRSGLPDTPSDTEQDPCEDSG